MVAIICGFHGSRHIIIIFNGIKQKITSFNWLELHYTSLHLSVGARNSKSGLQRRLLVIYGIKGVFPHAKSIKCFYNINVLYI